MRTVSTTTAIRTGQLDRYLAFGLALVALVAQLSGSAHLLLVRHALCPEHGELIHPTDEAEPALRAVAQHAKTAFVRPEAETELGHGHGHCPIAAQRRERGALIAAWVHVHASAWSFASRVPAPNLVSSCAAAILRFAPKNSPPA